MSQPAISKHLKVLEGAGLVSRGQDAQRRPRRLEAKPLAVANEWLERYRKYWEANYARLDALLEELKAAETPKRRRAQSDSEAKSERRPQLGGRSTRGK